VIASPSPQRESPGRQVKGFSDTCKGATMKALWHKIIHAGISPGMPPRTVRYMQNLNGISFMVGCWLFSLTPIWAYHMPPTKYIMWLGVGVSISMMCVPFLQEKISPRFARIAFTLMAYTVITSNAYNMGHETWNQLFLLASILIGFYIFESLAELIIATVVGLTLFAGLETLHFLGYKSPLAGKVPAYFFDLALYVDIYNIIFLTIAIAYYNRSVLNKIEKALDHEKETSERLLLNILPQEIANRLKISAEVIADQIPEATVLFADLVGFTKISQKMPAEELVTMLNEVFVVFDRHAKELGLEKIKTIGDAYMLASGIPAPRADHAQACISMAQKMLKHVDSLRQRYPELNIRIGIHSGSLVAGVIGESKFAYDLWGDTVNTASRMESHGASGRIHLSDATRQLLRDDSLLEPRGEVEIKGKGLMRTWFLRAA
jgi:adenylate cyclase